MDFDDLFENKHRHKRHSHHDDHDHDHHDDDDYRYRQQLPYQSHGNRHHHDDDDFDIGMLLQNKKLLIASVVGVTILTIAIIAAFLFIGPSLMKNNPNFEKDMAIEKLAPFVKPANNGEKN